MFPAPLMSTIGELGAFLSRETAAADERARERVEPASTNGEVVRP
jgi:hypothetical protein